MSLTASTPAAASSRLVRRPAPLPDGADPVLDDAADVVRHLLRTPGAMVTVVGDTMQTFVGASGPRQLVDGPRQVPVHVSFCSRVVAGDRPFVIDDATADPALREHPALTASGAVAYCGVPLRDDDGAALGSVCAVDHVPHAWTDDDVAALQRFSALLTRDLSLRRARQDAVRREALLDDTRALLSHDLRDALHSIGIAAELLPAVPDLPQRATELVGAIARRSAAATALLRRLLPDTPPDRATRSLVDRVRDVVEEYDAAFADVDVHFRGDGALRAEDRVLVPPGMLERSVAGLVRAAATGGAPGVVDVRIAVGEDRDLVVEVRREGGATGEGGGDAEELGETVAAFAADAWSGSFSSRPGRYLLSLPLAPRTA